MLTIINENLRTYGSIRFTDLIPQNNYAFLFSFQSTFTCRYHPFRCKCIEKSRFIASCDTGHWKLWLFCANLTFHIDNYYFKGARTAAKLSRSVTRFNWHMQTIRYDFMHLAASTIHTVCSKSIHAQAKLKIENTVKANLTRWPLLNRRVLNFPAFIDQSSSKIQKRAFSFYTN